MHRRRARKYFPGGVNGMASIEAGRSRYSVRLTETGVAALRGGALARPELP